jgi:hypothetical protein
MAALYVGFVRVPYNLFENSVTLLDGWGVATVRLRGWMALVQWIDYCAARRLKVKSETQQLFSKESVMNCGNFMLLAQQGEQGGGIGGLIGFIIYLAVIVIVIVGAWKIFEKAGKPGWTAIIPFYNLIVLLEIAGRPIWWFILLLIPFVGWVVGIIVCVDVAKKFGKGTGFGVGLALLSFIFVPLLGFGDAKYQSSN